jgi:hypothetical protein
VEEAALADHLGLQRGRLALVRDLGPEAVAGRQPRGGLDDQLVVGARVPGRGAVDGHRAHRQPGQVQVEAGQVLGGGGCTVVVPVSRSVVGRSAPTVLADVVPPLP